MIARFCPVPLPNSTDHGGLAGGRGDIRGMGREKTHVRARQPIFGQVGNGFKQRAAQFVVEIFRVQFLLPCRLRANVSTYIATVERQFSTRRKRSIDVRVVGTKPVSKRPAQKAAAVRGDAPFIT